MALRKLSAQIDSKPMNDPKALAATEGRDFPSAVEIALSEYVARKIAHHRSDKIAGHLNASIDANTALYRKLAKQRLHFRQSIEETNLARRAA